MITSDPNKVKDDRILYFGRELRTFRIFIWKLLKECTLADNMPGIDIIKEIIIIIQAIEIIMHLSHNYYCDTNEEASCYADFVKLTENNSDSRVKRFVADLENFMEFHIGK